ncbi:MAG: prolyl oligopeptidase family serine peptidase [Eubacteriales bacterium]|nr:prolyl oligopeptidase family serine peptidase [Eubacteriales bacterium]
MKRIIHTFMHDFGQMVDGVRIELDVSAPALSAEDFVCRNCFYNLGATQPIPGVKSVETEGNTLALSFEPFLFRCDFSLSCEKLDLTIKKENADAVELYHEELFRPVKKPGLVYRLYEPDAFGPRPLVLFLHGGGGCGEDNLLQLTDTVGAIKLAERVPDMYVMAPQAPAGGLSMEEMFAKMCSKGDPHKVILGADTCNEKIDRGWTREYLGRVIDEIRLLIAEGRVDARRVYVIGMSMGGFGTLKAVAMAPGLFAACAPICPSLNNETYPILENFPAVPCYISTAYIDHQVSRHAYILRAVQKLWDQGRRDVRFTIYSAEELAAYGIGVTEGISARELYAENHNSWILTLHNEYCILDWMFSHVKG